MLNSMMIHRTMLEPPCDSPVSFGHTATATPEQRHVQGERRGNGLARPTTRASQRVHGPATMIAPPRTCIHLYRVLTNR